MPAVVKLPEQVAGLPGHPLPVGLIVIRAPGRVTSR
jgi:hypothetical protein